MKKIKLYTDGACSQNPGPGGWAFVMILKDMQGEQSEQELLRGSGGEKLTTNNRMELSAVIQALIAYQEKIQPRYADCPVTLIRILSMCSRGFRLG